MLFPAKSVFRDFISGLKINILCSVSVSCFAVIMMPSACKNSDKLTVAEMEAPFKACISAVEKKARNLEKRKVTVTPYMVYYGVRLVHGCWMQVNN